MLCVHWYSTPFLAPQKWEFDLVLNLIVSIQKNPWALVAIPPAIQTYVSYQVHGDFHCVSCCIVEYVHDICP
jgi:hypothetical protein